MENEEVEVECEAIFLWMKCHITDRKVKVMKISTEIEKVAKANKITIAMLTLEQIERIKDSIYQKYSNKNRSVFLWESLADFSIINDKDGWALSADFVQEKKCIMFFDECEDKACIEITGGKDLHKLLSEMYGFERFFPFKSPQMPWNGVFPGYSLSIPA